MNAIGIDVSKGKSTVAVLRPFGEVVAQPFEIIHCDSDFSKLVAFIKQLPGESKVVMEATGTYHEPLARYLHSNGIFVSVVNASSIFKPPAFRHWEKSSYNHYHSNNKMNYIYHTILTHNQ